MEEEELKVSKNLLKTLIVETRTDILKSLEKRPMTASELSRKLGKHVTTVSEHLSLLKNSELVERVERPGRKWVYYRLTSPAEKILHPTSYKWSFVLLVAFLSFISSWYFLSVNSYPCSPFYSSKRAIENFQLLITTDNLQKAQLHIQHAEKRLEETKQIAGTGQPALVNEIVNDYQNEMTQAKNEIQIAKQRKTDVVPVLEILSESTAKQSAVLQNLAVREPQIAKEIQPALNTSEQTRVMAIQDLENITGVSYQK
jgi:DNA-binding transcriptional ArsR family regulator